MGDNDNNNNGKRVRGEPNKGIGGNLDPKGQVNNILCTIVAATLVSLMIGNGPFTRETETFRTEFGLLHPTFDNNQKHVSDIANEKVLTN